MHFKVQSEELVLKLCVCA